jgi:hypothetical protein
MLGRAWEYVMSHRFETAAAATLYTLAGRAVISLRSKATGNHLTFKVEVTKNNARRWFVSIKDQERYRYLGMLVDQGDRLTLALTSKSAHYRPSIVVTAFDYFAQFVLSRNTIPPELDVFHEGHCGRCGRTLTDPESIELGIGPECKKTMGL